MPRNALLRAALATSTLGILAAGLQVPTAATTAPTVPAASTTSPAPRTSPAEARAAAQAYLKTHRGLLNAAPGDAFTVVDTITTKQDITYVAFERTHRGLPVVGGDFVVAVNAAGRVTSAVSGQERTIRLDSLTPVVSGARAISAARRVVPQARHRGSPQPVVYAQGSPRLAWEIPLTQEHPTGVLVSATAWVDATTGNPIHTQDSVMDGTGTGYHNGQVAFGTTNNGNGTFSMRDPHRPGQECSLEEERPIVGFNDNAWGNGSGTDITTACVDAMYGMNQMWDMLDEWVGRDGIKGDGTGYPAAVGLDDANAFWSEDGTFYGHSEDGERQATSLDIVGHENGHGVFATTPGGYLGSIETAGMNEATGDILGTLTEAYADNPLDDPDFVIGEETDFDGTGPIRHMYDPSIVGHPNCWTPVDELSGPHAGSGPLNHWFYLLSQGNNPLGGPASPTCNGKAISGVGIEDAAKIFYHGLLQKTSYWDHAAARKATLQATVNLYGTADCTMYNTVRKAWNAISVRPQPGEALCDGTPDCTVITEAGAVDPETPALLPDAVGFSAKSGVVAACLDLPAASTLTLTLQRRVSPYTYKDVASKTGTGPFELAATVSAGVYRWRVEVMGQFPANFTLLYTTP